MKKTIFIAVILALAFGGAYLILKPYDYKARMEYRTFPGAVNQSIKVWNRSLDNGEILDQDKLEQIWQQLVVGDSIFEYHWKMTAQTEERTIVEVGVDLRGMGILERARQVFTDTDFEKRTRNTLLDFHQKLQEHLASFKVQLDGEAELPSTYCAYVVIQSSQLEKARGMMRNYSLLSSVILEEELELNGRPFVEILNWDMKKDSIEYAFCYPVKKKDSMPEHELVSFKHFEGRKALKATYNGNYISSDRAWYALLDEAERLDLDAIPKPVEVFFNNPNMGGDALKWKAEIYLPLK